MSLKSVIWMLALGLAQLGCLGGTPPTDHFYRLMPARPEPARAPQLAGVVEVERFATEGLLLERPLVYGSGSPPLSLHQYDYRFWSEPPPDMLQHQLVDYLRLANLAQRVVTPELRVDPDYLVEGRLDRLERVHAEDAVSVVLELKLALRSARDAKLLWLETYHRETRLAGDGIGEGVAALNRLLGEVYARFLGDLIRIHASSVTADPGEGTESVPASP